MDPPPRSAAAEIRSGVKGCLTLRSVLRSGRTFRVRGTARGLFEALAIRVARRTVRGEFAPRPRLRGQLLSVLLGLGEVLV